MIETKNQYVELENRFGGDFRESSLLDHDFKDPKHPVYWMEFYGARCPICGHDSWCLVNVTATKVICMRTPSEDAKKLSNGGYLYYLDDNQKINFDASLQKPRRTHKKASADVLDLFYRAVLMQYPLTDKHYQALHDRGLTDDMIMLHGTRGFGSYYKYQHDENGHVIRTPYKAQASLNADKSSSDDPDKQKLFVVNIWQEMLKNLRGTTNNEKFNDNYWFGVPGFYNNELELRGQKLKYPIFESNTDGMLVPFYNENNQIIGFQVRVDHVSQTAEMVKYPMGDDVRLEYNSHTRYYSIKSKKNWELVSGIAPEGKYLINLEYMGHKLSFRIKDGSKYFWVSSGKQLDGASSKSPVSVLYNPEIAKLDPTAVNSKTGKLDELKKIQNYAKQPKSMWVTEGSLKGLVASEYLSKRFSKEQLDEVGRDFLAVGGVSSYKKFPAMLKKLNVTSVTTAYDMDFQTNNQVKDSYRDLLRLLKSEGFKVRIANWDLKKAKGIDDALVKGIEIDFQDIN